MDWYNDKYDAFVNALKNARYEPKCNTVTTDIVKAQNEIYRKMVTAETAKTFTPQRILRHGIATIVFWQDGTKTVVKRHADELDNEYTAFCAALAIKVFGSNSQIKSVLRHKTETVEPKGKKSGPTETADIKVGDRVKYLGGGDGNDSWYPEIGGTGLVLDIAEFGVDVKWDSIEKPYWVHRNVLEVVE